MSAEELSITLECITTVETLISLAEPQNRIQMLTLLVPILIGFLLDGGALKAASKHSQHLHEHSLQWLMKIGPKYQQEFKALMAQSTDLRTRLESAIRNSQQTQQKSREAIPKMQLNQTPSIKLKTDFSNFS